MEGDILDEIALLPIDEILDQLAAAPGMDIVSIGLALIRAKDAAPRLIALMEDAAAGKHLEAEDENLLFYGVHILGAAIRPQDLPWRSPSERGGRRGRRISRFSASSEVKRLQSSPLE
jgi:hypothetical protein